MIIVSIMITSVFAAEQQFPEFELQMLNSEQNYQYSASNKKVVVIDFWATWCIPCRASLPKLEKMQEKYKDIQFIGVNIDNNKAKAEKFLNRLKLTFLNVYDKDKALVEKLKVEGMPSLFVVDTQGKIVKRLDGYTESQVKDLEQLFTDMAKK